MWAIEDIEDHIKAILCKNPDVTNIHSGTTEVTNGKPTKKKVKKKAKQTEVTNPDIQIIMLGLIHREDHKCTMKSRPSITS